MKKVKFLLLALAVFIAGIVVGQETVTRKVESFSKLHVSSNLDALVQQGPEESVKIVARGIGAARVITEVSDGDLHIYIDEGDYRNVNVKVYVTYKDLTAVDRSGSGNIEWLGPLTRDEFDFSISGSGSCLFREEVKTRSLHFSQSGSGNTVFNLLNGDKAVFQVSGSGALTLDKGLIKNQDIQLSGSANFMARGLQSGQCLASATGSGNIEVTVSDTLDATIAGSGSIIYNGNPRVNKLSSNGSGRVIKRS